MFSTDQPPLVGKLLRIAEEYARQSVEHTHTKRCPYWIAIAGLTAALYRYFGTRNTKNIGIFTQNKGRYLQYNKFPVSF